MICACCSNREYEKCCGRFLESAELPSTPEELMRSRYTAFTRAQVDYIADTQMASAAKNFNRIDAKKWAQSCEWLGLEVLSSGHEGDTGHVEFIAKFSQNNLPKQMHEVSQFKKINGKWFYSSGTQPKPKASVKAGRNDLCPCGSGKKFKKCCQP